MADFEALLDQIKEGFQKTIITLLSIIFLGVLILLLIGLYFFFTS